MYACVVIYPYCLIKLNCKKGTNGKRYSLKYTFLPQIGRYSLRYRSNALKPECIKTLFCSLSWCGNYKMMIIMNNPKCKVIQGLHILNHADINAVFLYSFVAVVDISWFQFYIELTDGEYIVRPTAFFIPISHYTNKIV